ncbi:hypothetical protein BFJ69_g16666 [Fusarium oxysporum]|uniref:Transmembrane protein n=1 Tax=Fusarium oxysporum TaxID=5507 RepID=A0A420MAJ3_FUSOX|nr:hypothetical protein BFJ69_g16666 [Fusarium oxysporum]
MMRAAAAFVDVQLQPRDNEDEGHDGTTSATKEQSMSGGLSLVATIVLVVLFTIGKTPLPVISSSQSTADLPRATTLLFVLIVFLLRRRRRISAKNNYESRSLGVFNFIRRQRSRRTSADSGSKIWWGRESVRSDDEATGRLRIASFDSEFVDHDGSIIRGERLTQVRKSLLRADHGFRP